MKTNKFKTKHVGIYRNEAGDKFYCCYPVYGKVKWESGFRSELAAINARAKAVHKKQIEEEEFPRNKLGWFIKHQYYPYDLDTLSESYRRTAKSLINKWILPYLGNKVIQAIDYMMLNEWRQQIKKDVIPDCTYKKVNGKMRYILSQARELGIIQSNPATKLRRVKYTSQEKRALTVDEVKRLVMGCNPYDTALIYVAVLSGLRLSELFGLAWTDIDFEQNTLTVQRQRNKFDVKNQGYTTEVLKTGNSRRTPAMFEELVRVLLVWRAILFNYAEMKKLFPKYSPYYENHQPEWVFPVLIIREFGSTPRNQDTWTRTQFKKIRKRNGFTDITFNTLRHTHKMLKRQRNVDARVVQKQMGHAKGSMSEGYDYVSIEEQQKEMDKLQYLIEAPKEEKPEFSVEIHTISEWQEISDEEEE